MNDTVPAVRRDLEFLPVQHEGRQLIVIRDHLGLVKEGRAVELPLYQFMTLLDGTTSVRDIQMTLMRQRGGMLVGTDEVVGILTHLDESFLLDSDGYRRARDQIVNRFTAEKVRPCSHCGNAYPDNPKELGNMLDDILNNQPPIPAPDGKVTALVAPHIDLKVGKKVYASAGQMLRYTTPSRVVILGVGHQMGGHLFSLTEKDFETPFGIIENEKSLVGPLRDAGGDMVAANDFAHRSEHSIEFQVIFLQHVLKGSDFTILPILCGFTPTHLTEYSRKAYLEKTGPFLEEMKKILTEAGHETLLLAGVDFSHIGPKFGHDSPADALKGRSEAHDKNLLQHLSAMNPDHFWEESASVEDQYNVCGFSALACLLEILPPGKGRILDYQIWHEAATRSAVSFAAMVFTSS